MKTSGNSLDLGQLRIQAKELLRAVRSGDPDAVVRARQHFPAQHSFRLASAQLVLARENGFPSWPAMQRQLEGQATDPVAELFKCVEQGDSARVRALLSGSTNLAGAWRRHEYGWESPLHVAAKTGHLEIAEALIQAGADVYPLRQSDYPPVFAAHYAGHKSMVEYLLSASAERDHGHPPTYGCGIDIILAARIGMLDRVEMHLRKDPLAIYRRGCIGESVLHWPAHNGLVQVLEALLAAGAVVEADEIGLYGGKPLHWAAEHAPASVRLLLQHGADPNSRNLMAGEFEGYTPLHMCARQPEQCLENVDLLVAAGADLSARDAGGRTPYDVAVLNGREAMAERLGRA